MEGNELTEGIAVGNVDGTELVEGAKLSEGRLVGTIEGFPLGSIDGYGELGGMEGSDVGGPEGSKLGSLEGTTLGIKDGATLGYSVERLEFLDVLGLVSSEGLTRMDNRSGVIRGGFIGFIIVGLRISTFKIGIWFMAECLLNIVIL